MSYFERVQASFHDSGNLDGFGRLRVSNPLSLFDGKTLISAKNTRTWDDTAASGSGTSSTFDANRASVTLGVGATTAGKRVRQTNQRFAYVPGLSQLALITFVHGALATGITRKIGLFDDKNGIFLNTTGTSTVQLVRRTYVGGSASDTAAVDQVDWNLDPMDGTGPSGIDLDFEKAQILVIDYEWLGVGRVRVGFNVAGVTYYAHEFRNANNLTSVYMSSPNLPIRYEIENSGAGQAASLECICSAVITEGGQNATGRPFGVANAALRTTLNGSGATRYALLAIRIAAANAAFGKIVPSSFSICGSTVNDYYAWELVLNPTIAGSPTWSTITDSVVEWVDGTSANTVTGGSILASGVGFSQAAVGFDASNIIGPGISRAGTPQTLALVIRPYANMDGVAGINWLE